MLFCVLVSSLFILVLVGTLSRIFSDKVVDVVVRNALHFKHVLAPESEFDAFWYPLLSGKRVLF